MMLKVLCERAAITVILVEVSAYARIHTILPEESQAVGIRRQWIFIVVLRL